MLHPLGELLRDLELYLTLAWEKGGTRIFENMGIGHFFQTREFAGLETLESEKLIVVIEKLLRVTFHDVQLRQVRDFGDEIRVELVDLGPNQRRSLLREPGAGLIHLDALVLLELAADELVVEPVVEYPTALKLSVNKLAIVDIPVFQDDSP